MTFHNHTLTQPVRQSKDGIYFSPVAMNNDTIMAVTPAVFAEAPHTTRSDKYKQMPTIAVVEAMRKEGFEVFGATQAKTRDASKIDFCKHLLRFRHVDSAERDLLPEVILINSHDGSCSYQVMSGIFRFACANGLVVGDQWQSHSVKHIGEDAIPEIIDATYSVVQSTRVAADRARDWQGVSLSNDEQNILANSALQLRYDDPEKPAPITGEQLLAPRRRADQNSDLWTVGNRIQENLIRGGQRFHRRDANNIYRAGRVRPIKGIDQHTALNKALWSLTEKMAELKSA